MADNFPLTEARLVSLFLESIFYGFYIITLSRTIRSFLNRHTYWDKPVHYVLALATATLAAFTTLDIAVALRQVLVAFVFSGSRDAGAAYLQDARNRENILRTICTPVLALISDGMLVYRCLVIYYYNWLIIIVPVILWVANFVCYTLAVYVTATQKSDAILNVSSLKPFLLAGMATSAVGSMLSTGLIALRLRRYSKDTKILDTSRTMQRRTFSDVMRVVIESGLLTTVANVILIITYLAGSNADYPVSDVLNIVYAISFNLIIIRLEQVKDSNSAGSHHHSSTRTPPIPLAIWDRRQSQPTRSRPIEVMVVSEHLDHIHESDEYTPTKSIDSK